MEPGFVAEEECIKHQNIAVCIVMKPSIKLSLFGESAGFSLCWIKILYLYAME